MKTIYSSPKVLTALLAIWYILLYLPHLKLAEIPTSNGGIPISLCYIFSLVFIPFLLLQLPKLRIPPWYITGLYAFVILYGFWMMPAYGLKKGMLHWLFGSFLLLVLVNAAEFLKEEDWFRIVQIGVLTFFVLHLAFNIFHWKAVNAVVFGGETAASLPSLTRGGRNLDASWLGLGCFLLRDRKVRFGCLLYSLGYSVLGVSRAGLLASGLCLVWVWIYDDQFGLRKRTALLWAGVATVGAVTATATGMAQRMLSRIFGSMGEGAISFLSGREAMWKNVWPMFQVHPFRVGVGNAIPVMRDEFGFASYEDVVHNVLFQWLLDEGFIGALWFVGLVLLLLYSQRNKRFKAPFPAYLGAYLILSMVQFHGGEALMIFVLGVYLASQNQYVRLELPRNLKFHRGKQRI